MSCHLLCSFDMNWTELNMAKANKMYIYKSSQMTKHTLYGLYYIETYHHHIFVVWVCVHWNGVQNLHYSAILYSFFRQASKKHENDSSEFDVSVCRYNYILIKCYSKKMVDVSKFSHWLETIIIFWTSPDFIWFRVDARPLEN